MDNPGHYAPAAQARGPFAELRTWLRANITRRDLQPLAIMLLVCILATAWAYFGKQESFYRLFGVQTADLVHQDLWSALYEYTSAFVLMACIPAAAGALLFRRSPREFGLHLGDTKRGLRLLLLGIPVMVLTAWVSSHSPEIRAEYPPARSMLNQLPLLFIMEGFYVLYYIGWEYMFRGFLLLGIEDRYGAAAAILIQTLPSALAHIGKPASEAFAAVIAGLVFGFVAVRTRSILYPAVLHSVLGISLDLWILRYLQR